MDDKDIKKIFTAHKVNIPDEGFSKRVVEQLPKRKNVLLPQLVMIGFIIAGLTILFVIQDFTPLLKQINSLLTSINHSQIPSFISIITYLGMLALWGVIGYSVVQAGTE